MQTTHVGEEREPGHRRAVLIPDPSAMTEVLEAAHKVTSYGVLRFAAYSGFEGRIGRVIVVGSQQASPAPNRAMLDPWCST